MSMPTIFFFLKWRYFSDIIIKWSIAMKICIVVLNLFMHISVISLFVYLCIFRFGVSLLRFKYPAIKTVNKIWWYKHLFFKDIYTKYNLKPKIYIVVIWLSSFFSISFSSLFHVFLLSVFFFSSMFSTLHNQENHDSKQYHSNVTLIRD